MSKSGEMFLKMQEENMFSCAGDIDSEYTIQDAINNIKSPKVIAIGKDIDGFNCVITGDSPKEVYKLAKDNFVLEGLEVFIPHKYIYNK